MGWTVRVQSAITLSRSEPEPDIVLACGTWRDYRSHHPVSNQIGLVVEVAESSLDRDRDDKGPLYAEAGIGEYWIVNLVDRQIEVYTHPTGTTPAATYTTRQLYRAGDSVPLTLDSIAVGQIAVTDILP